MLHQLVLFNKEENSCVWESFDHPTDSLVVGQWLAGEMKLRASISDSNWTQGLFSILQINDRFAAQLESNPPQLYYEFEDEDSSAIWVADQEPLFYYGNGNGSLFVRNNNRSKPLYTSVPTAVSAQHMKSGADGHLRVYKWQDSTWNQVAHILKGNSDEYCGYPLVCGR